jgi:hypothetical protein
MTRSIARTIHLVAAWLLVVCVIVQVFLAGLGVFSDPNAFVTHAEFGYLWEWLAVVMLILAIVGRLGRVQIGGAVLLIVLLALQSVFIALRETQPTIAALHPVNGFLVLLVGFVLAWNAWLAWRDARTPGRHATGDEPAAGGQTAATSHPAHGGVDR